MKTLALRIALLQVIVVGQQARVNAHQSNAYCKPDSLPAEIRARLNSEFSDWKIEKDTDLDKRALERWLGEQPPMCPGIAVGRFHESRATSTAVLLIPRTSKVNGYRFLIFTRQGAKAVYEMEPIDLHADDRAAPYLFIRKVQLAKTYSAQSRKRFQIRAADGLMLVASNKNEYEVDIYYWSEGKFQYSAIDR